MFVKVTIFMKVLLLYLWWQDTHHNNNLLVSTVSFQVYIFFKEYKSKLLLHMHAHITTQTKSIQIMLLQPFGGRGHCGTINKVQ